MNEPHFPFIRRRCAHLSEEDLREAERRFDAFLDIVAKIVDRRRAKQRLATDESSNTRGAHPHCAKCGKRENGPTELSL